MSVPNQKLVKINKERCNKDNIFAAINIEALHHAMTELDSGAFKLWMYFSKNQTGYQFELSYKDCAQWGIKKDAYYAAVRKLTDAHYLVPLYVGSNIYTFSEVPKTVAETPKTFSENNNPLSVIQNTVSDTATGFSEKPQRNNTQIIQNNTKIIQNSTGVYDYLYEEVLGDGYIKKEQNWIDQIDYYYGSRTHEQKIQCWMDRGYSKGESEFIVTNIMED